ncbi:mannonate dehydratase [Phenylobacterium sp. J367]|uniref:mannonate dehydratase n=1 Tax=Phenylobacterium sp. J367 TaxID=2898435 RepID=UPI002150C992|nr:mannonate dehydratase [Phenylobacterium sp. J367]MCR5879708.1 mannonate dehydratase [Phenylobacterium sp. J367]
MHRRQFLGATGLAAAALTTSGTAALAQESARAKAAKAKGKMKLGCQSGPATDEHFAFFARFGVKNICANPQIADPNRLYPTVDELRALQDLAGKYDISLDIADSVMLRSSHIDREKNPAIMLGQSPQRDRDIESFQTLIRNCAQAGVPAVKYNMSILGVLRNHTIKGPGDAEYGGWKATGPKPAAALTRAGPVDPERFWERIHYFLDRVVPVANEYKVRIACHPQDPGTPPEGWQSVHNVLGTIDGMKAFVAYKDSPYHGFNFCQGTTSENLANPSEEIFDVIRYFGSRKKIFNVHFRNIRGRRGEFVETYPDDGDVDFVRAIKTYQEVGYDGMLMPDHVPRVPGKPNGSQEGFAFAYGHIRGLLQALDA